MVVVVPRNACLFLDFDGTLVDFAPNPKSVFVTPDLVPLLIALRKRFDGALAVITGRTLDDIDRFLWPLRLPTAALHGTVRRDVLGKGMVDEGISVDEFAGSSHRVRRQFQRWAEQYPGVIVEDKGLAVALHFCSAQSQWTPTSGDRKSLESMLTTDLELLFGDLVLEVRPRGRDKSMAVEAFMAESPFMNRIPIYVGDDIVDLPAMKLIECQDGISIAVGARINARLCLSDPTALRRWLTSILRSSDLS